MSRSTRVFTNKFVIIGVMLAVLGLGGGGAAYVAAHRDNATVVVNSQKQLTEIRYDGKAGQTALTLLKQHARIQTKHYSFGDMVTTIDGTPGTGPKYWTFYVNGKMASVGAGSYVTKNSDTISWKLQ